MEELNHTMVEDSGSTPGPRSIRLTTKTFVLSKEQYTRAEDYPLVSVDFKPHCCPMAGKHFKGCIQHYIRLNDPHMKRLDGKTINGGRYDIAAYLDLNQWATYQDYIHACKKKHKGSALRHASKAAREGFLAKIFSWPMHIPDVVEINHSKEIRCGKPMREGYLRSVEEMGGYPEKRTVYQNPPCRLHHVVPWGVFKREKGYKQGEIQTNEKLLAYIKFLRLGEMVLYTMILGHGDYLKYGIMYFLHFNIMRWVYLTKGQEKYLTHGIRYIMYAQYFSGNQGLRQWKHKTLFEPARLIVYD